ncbi:MAG TPA: hypothetical protein VFT12_09175 [Thermoanaerobaculia bacterium]|nr:hypothetical protein [Thermoanaerobaculia bacterium]
MSRRIAIAALVALTFAAQPVFADFHRVARGLQKLGFEKRWIPFLGLARVAVRVVHPKGVHDFQIAVYEETPSVSGAAIQQMLREHVGRGYTPLVRVFSARQGESVFVYARPTANLRIVELIVLAHERNETVLVKLSADAEIVGREMGIPAKMGLVASR